MMSMVMARKNSRRILVDSQAYRWRLRSHPTYAQGLCWTPCGYAVEDYDRPGRRLGVTTGKPHPSNWLGQPAPCCLRKSPKQSGSPPDSAGTPPALAFHSTSTRTAMRPLAEPYPDCGALPCKSRLALSISVSHCRLTLSAAGQASSTIVSCRSLSGLSPPSAHMCIPRQ